MSNVPNNGAKYDLLREHLFNNSATYTVSGSQVLTDDYYTNAVNPLTPHSAGATRNGAYGSQQTTDDWHTQFHGDLSAATSTSPWRANPPTVPGT